MNIIEQLNDCLFIIKNKNVSYEKRIKALDKVWQYVNELKNTSDYDTALLKSLSTELKKKHISEYAISHMVNEVRKSLSVPEDSKKILIILGDNWISHSIIKTIDKKYYTCILDNYVNWKHTEEYNAIFILCEENSEKEQLLLNIAQEKIIHMNVLLNADFLKTPSHRKVFLDFEKGCKNSDIVGLVSGLSYGRDAVHCDLLIEPMLKLANSGQDLYYDFLCLQYAYRKIRSLKYVICTIAPYILRYDESLSKRKNNETLFYYTVFRDIHHNTDIEKQIEVYEEEKDKIEKIIGKGNWQGYSNQIYENYYYPRYGKEWYSKTDVFSPDIVEEREREMIIKQYNKPYDKTLKEYKKLLQEYCGFVKDKSLHLLFLIPPYSNYYKKIWNEDYYRELIEILKEMELLYHIEYLDMSHAKFPNCYFRDSGHLNRIGAIYVAEKINEWLCIDK